MQRTHRNGMLALGLCMGLSSFMGLDARADWASFDPDLPTDPGLFEEVDDDGFEDPAEDPGEPWFDDSMLEVPSEYPTIQAAIDAASPGSIIQLQPGYYGSFVHDGGFALTIRGPELGGFEPTWGTAAAPPVAVIGTLGPSPIEGQGIRVSRNSTLALVNVCVSGWLRPAYTCVNGGGVLVDDASNLHVIDSVLAFNQVVTLPDCGDEWHLKARGGAVMIQNESSAIFKRTEFIDNWAAFEGGAICIDMEEGQSGLLELSECRFARNGSEGGGGAICMTNTDGREWNGIIARNDALMQITASTFESNRSGSGGAVRIDSGAAAIVACSFHGNTADSGGALRLAGPVTMHMEACAFTGNDADYQAGAVHYGSHWLRRIPVSHDEDGRILESRWEQVQHEQQLHIANSTFESNTAAYMGGAMRIDGANFSMSQSEFQGNTAGRDGSAVYAATIGTYDDEPALHDNVFCGNPGKDVVFYRNHMFSSVDWAATGNCISEHCRAGAGGTECAEPADVNGDGVVDSEDLMRILAAWRTSCSGCPEDVDGNGFVGIMDALLVIEAMRS